MYSDAGDGDTSSCMEAVLAALRKASSDTEKLAAILVLTKVTNAAILSERELSSILKAVGVPFIVKLLRAPGGSSECPPEAFISLGLHILGTFTACPALSGALVPAVEALKPLLLEDDNELVNRVLVCLRQLSAHQSGCEILMSTGFGESLAEAYKNKRIPEALDILAGIVDSCERLRSEPWLEGILRYATVNFSSNQGRHKFDLCHALSKLLTQCDISEEGEQFILGELRKGLKDILTSRMSAEMRTASFSLLASVLDKFGAPFVAEWDDGLFSLAILLAGGEVQLQLEGEKDVAILIPCYRILEVAFQNLDVVSSAKLNCVLGSIRDTFKVVIEFMTQASSQTDEGTTAGESLVLATARVLCAWLAEDSTSLREQVAQVLPFLLKFATRERQLIPFLVPGLCHITADDGLRRIVLEKSFLPHLFEYFTRQWTEFCKDCSTAECLEAACGVFLNVVVLEQQTMSDCETEPFSDLLTFCLTNSQTVPRKNLPLKGNIVVLGLFLLRLKKGVIRMNCGSDCEVLKRFLLEAAEFLKEEPNANEEDLEEILNLQSLGIGVLEELQEESRSSLGAYVRNVLQKS